jgi:hypothetical protein
MKPLLIILLLSALFIVGCAQKQKIPDGAVFQFETYGGFVPAEMAKQIIIIDKEKIIYIIFSSDNKVTETYQKKILPEEYDYLLKLLNDKNFLGMNDKYSPPEVTVADVGNAKLSVNFGNTSKIVTLEPYFLEYYPDNVRLVFEAMQSYVNTIYDLPEEQLKTIAEEWIRNAPTYVYDGEELQFKKITALETYPVNYILQYSFKSKGYGDRSKIAGVQMLTDHEIVIAITKGKVVGAIIDGKWNEFKQELWESTLKFEPLQCIKTPWRKWYDAGNIQFIKEPREDIKEPREEELVIAYYGQVYGITVQNFKLVSGDSKPIMCGNPESYYYTLDVLVPDREKMLKLGWEDI